MKFSGGTSTKERPAAPGVNGSSVVIAAARVPLRTRQRRPAQVALGVVLIVGLGVLGGVAYEAAGSKQPVVTVVREIPKGHVVTAADLSTVDVSGGVVAVAGDHLASVLGETATVDLLPGTLLQRSMVSAGPSLAGGMAQGGVAVTGGQVPADGLASGDTVEVLALPAKGAVTAAGAAPTTATVLAAKATVFSSRPDPSSASGTLVTLTVPASAAAGIATASGDSLVALVQVSP